MQSSAVVASRALIMLGSLVLLPLAAMFGVPLPEQVAEYFPELPQIAWDVPDVLRFGRSPGAVEANSPSTGSLSSSFEWGEVQYRHSGAESSGSPSIASPPALEMVSFAARDSGYPASKVGGSANEGRRKFAAGTIGDLRRRLEKHGAADATIADWGPDGALYRCACQIAIDPDGSIMRHFEAIAESPEHAVERVIAEIRAFESPPVAAR